MNFRINVLLIFATFFSSLLFSQSEDFTKYLAEARAFNKMAASLPELDISTPENLSKTRALFPNTTKIVLTPTNRVIENVRVRIYRPDTIRAVVMQIHGGGLCIGSPEQDDGINDAMARSCKVAVVSVAYRLAPENPYPEQEDDCETILTWLLKNSYSEFGVGRIILSGESAGSHLATVTLIRLRNKKEDISKVVGLSLFYGAYDFSGTPSLRQDSSKIFLTRKFVNQLKEKIFPDKIPEQLRDSTISPLFANLSGLPPAIFSVGALDPLIDDSKFMAARWESAGNQTTLKVYPECPHSFNRFPTQMAKLANDTVYKWINNLLK
jgi:acetyl esterase/lipase